MTKVDNRLAYLTHNVPGVGGRMKTVPGDFRVEEIPLYEASGEGTHTYFLLEKEGVTTIQAVRQVARALDVPEREIGYAGLKDADAITRQVMSVEHIDPARVLELSLPRIRIEWARPHRNKLKLGHLWGNRFVIRIRETDTSRCDDVRAMLATLERKGVPNYFGPQRFGRRGDNWEIGRAIIRQDWRAATDALLGRPLASEGPDVRRAREAYEAQDYAGAADAWPPSFRDEKRACRALAQTQGAHKRAVLSINMTLRRLYLSAFQSYLFNSIVAARQSTLDQLIVGDLAWRHASRSVFSVEDAAVEQPRCDAFEISPSGPLFGYRMTEAKGEPGATEARVLAESGLEPRSFRQPGGHKTKGARRPLRFQPTDIAVETGQDEHGPYLELRFALRAGCYATALLREVCKTPAFDVPTA